MPTVGPTTHRSPPCLISANWRTANDSSAALRGSQSREDPDGLIWADRLDQAAERAHDDPDIDSRRTTLVLLAQLQLNRGQPEIALHLADEAVLLDSDDENAWVTTGYAELVGGDVTSARESLRQALRVNCASSGATALQATIEHLSGDENAPFTLARAVTLGVIFRPPG